MQRYIKIPTDIAIVDIETGQPVLRAPNSVPMVISFKNFICGTLLKDPAFGKTVAAVIAGAGLRAAMETSQQVLKIEGDEYELLKKVLEAPDSGYRSEIAIQLVPFFRAILDATTTDPQTG
jgi:hypothetical protein